MRERSQPSAVARRVPIEAYPSPGKGGGGDGYQRPQRQPQRQQQQQQQQEQPPRPHSYIGFSRPDSYGGNLDFYSSRFNRNANRYTPGNSGSLFKSTLRHNKSSNDLLSSERTDVCASPSLYRELLNGSPSPSNYRELVNPSPAQTFTGRLASREISPLRSQSVLSNRSNLQYNFRSRKGGDNTRDTTPNRQSNIYNNRYNNRNRSTSHDRQAENETNNTYRNVDDTSFGLTQDKGKRKSSTGVTFALPEDGNSSDEQTSVYGQFSISAAAYRRMSAPELPPIANNNTGKGGNNKTPRGDKRKTSTNSINSSGSKASINQLAAAVNSKTYYNRKASTDGSTTGGGTTNAIKKGKKKKLPIPRNHSDSSLKNLVANTSSQSQESGSTVHSYPTATADGGGGSSSGGGGGPRGVKFLSNGHRALSWCATDNSGSQTKLETLFERQVSGNVENDNSNNNNINNNSGSNNNLNNLTIPATSNNTTTTNNNNNNNSLGGRITYSPLGNPITKASSSNSISNLPYNNSSNSLNNITDMPAIVSGRSVSVNGIRSKEDIKRLEALNQKLISENGDVEIDTVDEFVSRGRMRRSNSENKLAGKSHQRNSTTSHSKQQQHKPSQRSLSRNLSVDRIDRLTSKPQRNNPIPSRTGANSKLRRVSSVTNLQNNRKNNRATFNDENNEEEVFEDEESIEASARLVEWLNVVNNVDEYDTDPKDTIVEYSDEPPQTDTAVHVVYEGE